MEGYLSIQDSSGQSMLMSRAWHGIHTLSTHLWSVLRMVQLLVLISGQLNLNTLSEPKSSFTLHAHDKAVSSISYNPLVPKLLATGSTDKMVKLWDLSNDQPSCIASKNLKAGAVFSICFSEDCPFRLAIGGSKGKLEVWETLSDSAASRRYGKYVNRNKTLST